MAANRFSYTPDELKALAQDALDYAKKRGASAAEAEASEGFGQTVTVRQREVEKAERRPAALRAPPA